MSAEPRYYYVDAQNQAAGPLAMAGLLALKASGTITDATLVVIEGGTEWVAFSTLKPVVTTPTSAAGLTSPAVAPSPLPQDLKLPSTSSSHLEPSEPLWASQLSQKVDRLVATMEKLIVSLEKTRPAATPAPVMAPATAALHAEKINLNPAPKPGIAAQNPVAAPRPAPLPAGIPVASPRTPGSPAPVARPGIGAPLSPLAVPANAQKSALPLPALGKAPGPAPAPAATAPAKGNIFSKFLKK